MNKNKIIMAKKSKPTKKDEALQDWVKYLQDGKVKKSFEDKLDAIIEESFYMLSKKMEFSDYSLADILALDENGFIEYTKCQPEYITSLPGDLRSNDPNVLNERLDEIDKRKKEVDEHISDLQVKIEEEERHLESSTRMAEESAKSLLENDLFNDDFWTNDVYGSLEKQFAENQWEQTDEYTSGEYKEKYGQQVVRYNDGSVPEGEWLEHHYTDEFLARIEGADKYYKDNKIGRQDVIDGWTKQGYGDFINDVYSEIDRIYDYANNEVKPMIETAIKNHDWQSCMKGRNEIAKIGYYSSYLGKLKRKGNGDGTFSFNSSLFEYQDKFTKPYSFTEESTDSLIGGAYTPFGATMPRVSRASSKLKTNWTSFSMEESFKVIEQNRINEYKGEIARYQKQSNDFDNEYKRTSNKLNS